MSRKGQYEPKPDSRDKIMQCLSCRKPECNNCKAGRRGNPVLRIAEDGAETLFQSIRAAAMAEGVSYSAIRNAIAKGGKAAGARWRYAEW